MPLVETLPLGTGCAQWALWGTTARIVVTDPDQLDAATDLIRAELAAVERACSRFRPDSEIEALSRRAGLPARVSPRLAALVTAALHAAYDTDGDVDPTLAAPMAALGYDRDFATLAVHSGIEAPLVIVPSTRWEQIRLDGDMLTVPAGARLDLGATGKAWAADRCADLVATRCDTGVLVALGGDIATAGPAPEGWDILVQDGPQEPACTVTLPAGAAIATSSTISRSWQRGSRVMHHILDPRSGYPAERTWRTVSVVSGSCVRANTLSTAAIVRGVRALSWLAGLDAPARLVAQEGSVTTRGGWPAEPSQR
jgi:FAD:protein FMN transferase